MLSQALEAIEGDCPTDAWKLAECLRRPERSCRNRIFSRFDPESQAEKDEAYAIFKGRRLLREQRQRAAASGETGGSNIGPCMRSLFGARFSCPTPKEEFQSPIPCCAFSLSGDGVIAETELVVEGNLYRQGGFQRQAFRVRYR